MLEILASLNLASDHESDNNSWQNNEDDDNDDDDDKEDSEEEEFTIVIVMMIMITELMIVMKTFAELKYLWLFLLMFFSTILGSYKLSGNGERSFRSLYFRHFECCGSTRAGYLDRQTYRNKKIDENGRKVSRYPSSTWSMACWKKFVEEIYESFTKKRL